MDSKRSSSFSASKGACPESISYSSTPRAHQSTEGPYSISCRICENMSEKKNEVEHEYAILESLNSKFKTTLWSLVRGMCWISGATHWGVSVEGSKGVFHKRRCTFLVREKALKHEDAGHLNSSLWKPNTPLKAQSEEVEIWACQVNKLTSQVCCLPVRREGAWSAGQRPQCLLLVRWCDGN